MTVYKVPQDVEADDKLLGPFSFRQFIYLIAVALGMAAAWALGNLFLPLAVIPLPVILFFGALALPLRKDQPMEVYLAALASFYLKPRKHLWQPDGITSLIEVTAPKIVEVQRTKDLSQSEAERRLSYLANLVDSGGWAVRGVHTDTINSSMNSDVYYEAQGAVDVLDNSATVNKNFSTMIEQGDEKRRKDIINRMHQQSVAPPPPPQSTVPTQTSVPEPSAPLTPAPALTYNPYPVSMNQSVVQPLSQQQTATSATQPEPTVQSVVADKPQAPPQTAAASTSTKPISPDIINLANQNDLSIETIAREANRIRQKELDSEEVLISLR